ncbi:hypothetical protein C0J52_24383 [Blattella germanica]|nr:hypothetical protein C0J52_24383 [Blattella germanica]
MAAVKFIAIFKSPSGYTVVHKLVPVNELKPAILTRPLVGSIKQVGYSVVLLTLRQMAQQSEQAHITLNTSSPVKTKRVLIYKSLIPHTWFWRAFPLPVSSQIGWLDPPQTPDLQEVELIHLFRPCKRHKTGEPINEFLTSYFNMAENSQRIMAAKANQENCHPLKILPRLNYAANRCSAVTACARDNLQWKTANLTGMADKVISLHLCSAGDWLPQIIHGIDIRTIGVIRTNSKRKNQHARFKEVSAIIVNSFIWTLKCHILQVMISVLRVVLQFHHLLEAATWRSLPICHDVPMVLLPFFQISQFQFHRAPVAPPDPVPLRLQIHLTYHPKFH